MYFRHFIRSIGIQITSVAKALVMTSIRLRHTGCVPAGWDYDKIDIASQVIA